MSKIDLSKLTQPTPEDRIKHRTQAGVKLSYVDARYCMDILDEVVGPENWSDDYKEVRGLLMCGVSINVNGVKVTKWDTGTEANFEGEKSIVSDSFKRACVKWGIARDLYDIKKAGVKGNATPTLPSEPSLGSPGKPQPNSPTEKQSGYVLNFGKHSGKFITEIPLDYLKWFLNQKDNKKDEKTYNEFLSEYQKRMTND
jgi:hypothetical protein